MRFVIYDDETNEPITVVSVPWFGERDIERLDRHLYLSLQPEATLTFAPDDPPHVEQRVVMLRFEQFIRRGQLSWMCFTQKAELAMLLEPDFLPGQRGAINDLEAASRGLVRLFQLALQR